MTSILTSIRKVFIEIESIGYRHKHIHMSFEVLRRKNPQPKSQNFLWESPKPLRSPLEENLDKKKTQ